MTARAGPGRGRRSRLLGPEPRPQPHELPDAEVVVRLRREARDVREDRPPLSRDHADDAASRTLLDDPSVDAVAIATPVSTHYELAERALEAGKHVFVEKPLAALVATRPSS